MKTFLYPLLLMGILISCQSKTKNTHNDSSKTDPPPTVVIQELNEVQKSGLIKGFAVAVVNDAETIFEKGFGYTDIDTTKTYTATTTQPVASISKVMIGLALIKAEEMNLLSLEDPVTKYVPFHVENPDFPNTEILIKHLAYHTSSIVDKDEIYVSQFFLENDIEIGKHEAEDYYDFFQKAHEKTSLENYLMQAFDENMYEDRPYAKTKPGETREYSNIGADLCALVIQNASKKDFRDFTVQHILEPLQMNNTSWRPEKVQQSKRSRLFVSKDILIPNYVQGCYPNGSLRTSAHDLGLFLSELMRGYQGKGTILSKEGFKKFYQKRKYDGEYYGCFIEYTNEWLRVNDSMIGHDGSDPGVFTGMFFNPERNTGKILISNTDTDYTGDEKIWKDISTIWESLIAYEIEWADENHNRTKAHPEN